MRYQNQLVDLCYRLRDEKLLVNADIDSILRLNTEVEEQILELVKICWIHCHQHRTLSKLLQSHPDATVQNACSQLCQLENAHFSDSKKQLANNETTITEILRLLLNSSKLVATVLHFFECVEPNLADELCFTFFCSVYGSCQFVNDEKCLYAVLCDLMRLQFSHCEGENLRRMLRRGSGAFCKMYRLATGSLFSVSLFLASALYQPIMQLISQNEQLLEIDPTKAAMRFSATEKLANWGLEGSSQYKENIANYRKIIIQRLVLVSNNFIQSIRDSLHCFPVPLAWLLRQLHFFLSDCLKLTTSECDQICTELIFSYIICPAIANPEAFGILSDTPVSSVARFNLMQIGQILQALAVCPWDRLDSKLNDLYSQFDTNSVHMLYRAILSDTVSIPLHRSNLDDIYTMEVKLARRHAAFSTDELNQLLNALRQVVENSSAPAGLESCWQELKQLLNSLPTTILLPSMNNNNNNSTIVQQQQQHRTPSKQLIDLTEAISSSTSRSTVQSSTTTRSRSCMKLTKPLATMSLMRSPSESNVQNVPLQQQQQQQLSSPPALFSSSTITTAASLLSARTGYPDVFLFAISDPQQPVVLFGEERFLSMMRQMKYGREESSCNAKRTRFMLAVDSDSLGANSDQLDEVASDEQRSDCSSAGQLTDHADMSALNDNFSDVDAVPMSANVSGRGSPSISGRDTPSSVPADQNDNAFEVSSQSPCGSGDMRQKTSCCSLPLPTMKANAMEERFGKFAMMPTRNRECHRDETHSMVSDSWSTDVLASDSEFGGDVQQSQLPLSSAWLPDIVPCPAPQAPRLDLISEKAQHLHTSASVGDHSDTWSVEASDSDNDPNQRLRDIENDVFQSVSGVGENSRHILKSPVSDDGDSVSEQGLPCAYQSTKPVHRQSSGSSLYSEIPDEGSSCGAGPSSSSLSSGAYLQHRPKQQQQRTWKTVPVQELSSSFRPYFNATSNHKSCPGVADGNYPSVCFRAGGDKVDEFDREEMSVVFHNESTAMPSGSSSSSVVRTTPTAAAGFGNSSNNLRTNFATTVAKKLSPHVNRVIGLRGSSFSSPSIAATTATTATATTTTTTLTTNADLAAPFSSIAGREGLFRGFRGLKPLRGRTPARNDTNKLLGNGESAAGSSSVQGESACDSADGAPFASRDYAAETGDQILDKYRCMALRNDDEPGGPTTTTTTTPLEPLEQMDEDTARPYYDSNNLTECQAFVDLKRKLRLILSTVDVDTLPVFTFRLSQTCSSLQQVKEHDELKQFLRVQLAETLISERMSLCVQIEDALRTLSYFDSKGVRKLLKTMHEEHGRRSAYVNYVQQSKLSLLQSKMFIKKLLNRITREQKITIHSVVEFCVRFYLEQRFDSQIKAFVHEFQQLQLLDEKTHLLSTFLSHIYSSLQADSLWNGSTSDQLEWIRLSIERMITARIYVSALYPNGEVDVMRDRLFHQTVQRLGDLITPTHKSLAIPTEYIAECPWPSAQAEILKINVYKSAGDKVKCVRRCCETIMHLLRASNAQTPSADDMVPLVVYVLIKANPEALLSTIQYVNGFYSGRMEGEEAYCWTQFCSAVEYIKMLVDDGL